MTEISDGFTNLNDWTIDAGDWTATSSRLQWDKTDNFQNARIRHDTQLATADYYFKCQVKDPGGGTGYSHSPGIMIRSTGASGDNYQVIFTNTECRVERYSSGSSFEETLASNASPGVLTDYWIGVIVEGAGTSTSIRIWSFGSTDPDSGGSPDPDANWGTADRTISLSGASGFSNSGKYVGFRAYGSSSGIDNSPIQFDSFQAGDYGDGGSSADGAAMYALQQQQ